MTDLKTLIETYASARYESGVMNYSGSPEMQEVATEKVRAAGEALNKALMEGRHMTVARLHKQRRGGDVQITQYGHTLPPGSYELVVRQDADGVRVTGDHTFSPQHPDSKEQSNG